MKSFHQKVAVVTGAASGFGRELGVQLAASGAFVALADVHAVRLEETASIIRQAGGKASTHLVDVSKKEQIETMADDVLQQHGQVDILVNNAGVALGLISIRR